MAVATTMTRRLDWCDTDAAGHWHFSTLFRLVEAAEAQLHRELGISERTFGKTPRVRIEADYRALAHFDDILDVTLEVADLGRTAVTYDVQVTRAGEVVATCRVVTVLVGIDGRPLPWPDDLAAALRGESAA
jgi:YbgC/YbaW family acyl-CoA thioester hydrolase